MACCLTVNQTLRNIFQWTFAWNLNIFIEENTFENVIYNMAAILFNVIFCQFIFFPVSSSREPTTNGTEGGADDCAEQITGWAGKFAHKDSTGKGQLFISNHLSKISARNCKNIEGYTAHIIVSWPNPKQWQMDHTSNLMMMTSSTGILTIIIRKMGKLNTQL